MPKLLIFLLVSLLIPFAYSQQSSPQLSEDELRIVLEQLRTYEIVIKENDACAERLKKEQTLDATEDEHMKELLDMEKQRTALAKREVEVTAKERDLEKDRADFYEQQFKMLTKKPPLWCRILRNIPIVGLFTSCR